MFKEKLEGLKERCSKGGYDLVYSEYEGIATVTIIDSKDEDNMYGFYEDNVSDDNEREDFLETIADEMDERLESYNSLQELVPFMKSLIV